MLLPIICRFIFNWYQIIQSSLETVTQRQLDKNSPYQGLKRFNFKDRDRFFGRDKLITRLFEAVNRSSLSLVLGASGSGKSSVVRAGLIPELKKSLESQTFYDFIFSPHQDPFDSLYRCLLSEEKDYSFSKSEVEIALEAKADTLTKVISTLKKEEERWLIFVDQFEELFTICDDADKRKNFISGLVQVAKSGNSSVKIVLAIRSDFLEQFSFYPDLGVIANQNNIHLVTEMYPDELRQAIEQPAAKHGVVFEEGLLEQIIKEVEGQKGYLPLLQYTLNLLWESECKTFGADGRPNIEDRTLNKKSYASLEGVRGALQKRINLIYQNLNQDEQIVTKQVFVRLVNIVDTDLGSKAVSRRAYRNEFTEKPVEKIVNKFINENILVSNYDYRSEEKLLFNNSQNQEQAATVEIAHEILLTSWNTLQRWIEEEKEAIIFKHWLASEARRWQRIRRGNESKAKDELLKGSRLNQIVELKNKDAFKNLGGFTTEEKQFIDASLAWQNQIIQREKRQIFILRSLLSGTTIALVLAIFTSIYAFTQATIAGLGEQVAKARLKKPLDGLVTAVKLTGESQDKLIKVPDSVSSILFDFLQKPVERNILIGHKQNVTSVTFSPDGNYIASSSEDKTVRLWNLDGYPVGKPFRGHDDYVNAVNFSPDGRYIVTGSSDKTVRLWNLQGNSIGTPFKGHQGVVRSVAFSPDSQYIISGGDDGMRLWDLKGNVIQPFLKLKGRQIKSVAFSRDGQTIVIASGTLQFWDRKGNSIAKPIEVHVYGVSSLAISPDGKYIVTSGVDNIVQLIDFQKKTMQKTIPESDINSVGFSPDSKSIAIASGNTVRVRDLEGNLIEQPFLGHDDKVISVAFSPLGKNYIVTGSWDKTIRLWNLGTLKEKVSNSEDYKASLKLACNKLLFHSVFVKAETEEARDASKTCQKYAWDNIKIAQFLVNQGKAIARQANLAKAVDSFKQAQKLDSNLSIDPEAEAKAQRLAAMASIDSEEQNNTEIAPPTLPNQATYGQVKLTDFILNNKSNVISVAPGEKINGSTNYIYDCPECDLKAVNQIIVGIVGQNSAQACIYDQRGSKGAGSSTFTLTAPSEPGIYYIRFRYAQARRCQQGALGWWRVNNEPTAEANIGSIIIRQGKQPKQ
ncbi:NACHT and WD repeat domain-containing protein [Nostoc sp. ChiSLP03a]|uniref:NACHT and WD repeat domain-containing protein n=1 Tax=Nostoc sp. ChiSLP03a TaxID=3075380 RepID=UPI00391B0F6F